MGVAECKAVFPSGRIPSASLRSGMRSAFCEKQRRYFKEKSISCDECAFVMDNACCIPVANALCVSSCAYGGE